MIIQEYWIGNQISKKGERWVMRYQENFFSFYKCNANDVQFFEIIISITSFAISWIFKVKI